MSFNGSIIVVVAITSLMACSSSTSCRRGTEPIGGAQTCVCAVDDHGLSNTTPVSTCTEADAPATVCCGGSSACECAPYLCSSSQNTTYPGNCTCAVGQPLGVSDAAVTSCTPDGVLGECCLDSAGGTCTCNLGSCSGSDVAVPDCTFETFRATVAAICESTETEVTDCGAFLGSQG